MKIRHVLTLAFAAFITSTAHPQSSSAIKKGLAAIGGEGGGGGGGGSSSSSSSSSGGNNSVPAGLNQNLPLQNPQKVFTHSLPRLVNDVRAIVGLPPLSVDAQGNLVDTSMQQDGGAILDADKALLAIQKEKEFVQAQRERLLKNPNSEDPATFNSGEISAGFGGSAQPATVAPLYIPPERPQVIYNSDQNFLWVVATRKQHKWVAEYLSKVDKPQTLIAIEVKFLETKKNPQTQIGINWENTFGSGLTVSGGASIGGSNIGNISFTNGFANSIVNSVATNTSTDARLLTGQVPYSAVLTLNQFSATLQAFMQDRDTSIVQYPRVLTLNNREVAITSAEYTPLNVGTSTAVSTTGTAGTTVGSLQYLPTGTQINILPKVVNADQIAMTVAITVSSVVGELPLNLGTGVNLYPVTSSRVYNASLQVDSGYTLAVGGLEKVDDRDVQGGIPVLKDIPALGYLFKNINKKRDKLNLLIFITPYLIGDAAKTPGVSEFPESIVPLRPGVPPQPPVFTPDGKLSGGEEGVSNAIAWLDFQLRYFRQINFEAMMTPATIQKLRDVIGVARALVASLQVEAGPPPYDPDTTNGRNALKAEELVTDLNQALSVAQDKLM
jgi:type II secretory pathway component GspD/PulD (secretin)